MKGGIAGLKERERLQDLNRAAGEGLLKQQLNDMQRQMETFKESLQRFAAEHRAEIQREPAFRAMFHEMCSRIGVDPLASRKGWWNDVLGIGDFYYELGVQVVEACLVTRPVNGGLLDMQDLLNYLQRRRNPRAPPVGVDDISRAVSKLAVLGQGFKIVTIGGRKMVQSVPRDLAEDHGRVLAVAEASGFTSVRSLSAATGWPDHRARSVLEELLRAGMCMLDDGARDGQVLYWFPSFGGVDASTASAESGTGGPGAQQWRSGSPAPPGG